MALSVLSGRIRPRPRTASHPEGSDDVSSPFSSLFSVTAVALPTGTITVHSSDPPRSRSCLSHPECNDDGTDDAGGEGSEREDTSRTYRRTRCNVYNLEEVHNFGPGPIVDHCWTTLPTSCVEPPGGEGDEADDDGQQRGEVETVLAVLTRTGGGAQPPPDGARSSSDATAGPPPPPAAAAADGEAAAASAVAATAAEAGSVVRLYRTVRTWYRDGGGGGGGRSSSRASCSTDLTRVRTLALPSFASSVAMGGGALVVSTPSGAAVYRLASLLDDSDKGDAGKAALPVELMRNHCVHALSVVGACIVAASGDRLGVWSVDTIFGSDGDDELAAGSARGGEGTASALWSTTIEGCTSRITSVTMSGDAKVLAASCWDGSAYVYRSRGGVGSCNWDRVVLFGGRTSPPWEVPATKSDVVFPTFVALSPTCSPLLSLGGFGSAMLAVSAPGSGPVRCFDIDRGEKCQDFGPSVGVEPSSCYGSVHGLLSVKNIRGDQRLLLWIDEKDIIHQQQWPVCLAFDMSSILLVSPRGEYRTLVALRKSSFSSSGAESFSCEAWIALDRDNQSWRLECAWRKSADLPEERVNLAVPFLSDKSAIDVVAQASAMHPKRAFICDFYVGILSSSDSVLYVYSRLEKAWRVVDTDNSYGDASRSVQDGACYSFIAPQYIVETSLSSKNDAPMVLNARIWDLSLPGECFITSKNMACQNFLNLQGLVRLGDVEVYPLNENSRAVALCCNAWVGGYPIIIVWEMSHLCSTSTASDILNCVSSKDIICSHDGIVFLGVSTVNGPEGASESCLDEIGGHKGDGALTAIHIETGGLSWQYIPKLKLWRPQSKSSRSI